MKTQIKPETPQDYLNLSYPITLYPEPDGGYTAMLSDLLMHVARRYAGRSDGEY
jgi:antitoxin HicB